MSSLHTLLIRKGINFKGYIQAVKTTCFYGTPSCCRFENIAPLRILSQLNPLSAFSSYFSYIHIVLESTMVTTCKITQHHNPEDHNRHFYFRQNPGLAKISNTILSLRLSDHSFAHNYFTHINLMQFSRFLSRVKTASKS
jgi:hypothetical protein